MYRFNCATVAMVQLKPCIGKLLGTSRMHTRGWGVWGFPTPEVEPPGISEVYIEKYWNEFDFPLSDNPVILNPGI